jgi:uncharacterized protein with PCYCGC motif
MTEKKIYTLVLPVFLIFGLLVLSSCSKGPDDSVGVQASSLKGGETRETLPPGNFSGVTAQAYQVAKDMPEVLDNLYCYCDCKKHFGHKSLLTCYVDEHAKNCDICLNEALLARELHNQGKDAKAIREIIDQRFGDMHHGG